MAFIASCVHAAQNIELLCREQERMGKVSQTIQKTVGARSTFPRFVCFVYCSVWSQSVLVSEKVSQFFFSDSLRHYALATHCWLLVVGMCCTCCYYRCCCGSMLSEHL